MKIIITLLLALFISSQAYALSPELEENILLKGKVIATSQDEDASIRVIMTYSGKGYICLMQSRRPKFICEEIYYD